VSSVAAPENRNSSGCAPRCPARDGELAADPVREQQRQARIAELRQSDAAASAFVVGPSSPCSARGLDSARLMSAICAGEKRHVRGAPNRSAASVHDAAMSPASGWAVVPSRRWPISCANDMTRSSARSLGRASQSPTRGLRTRSRARQRGPAGQPVSIQGEWAALPQNGPPGQPHNLFVRRGYLVTRLYLTRGCAGGAALAAQHPLNQASCRGEC
jgi:hypothetical protein